MSFSAGTYSLPGPALNTGDTVSATENNTFRNDVATAFNLTMLRNGTSTATANLPMGGFKLTGLGVATTSGDALSYGQTATVSDLTASGAFTLSGGTANGVAYLNASKVLTTGSALTFDGTNFGVGASTISGVKAYFTSQTGNNTVRLDCGPGGYTSDLTFGAYGYAAVAGVKFEDANALLRVYVGAGRSLAFNADNSEGMRLTSTGLGIGTSSPSAKLDVQTSGGASGYFTNTTVNSWAVKVIQSGSTELQLSGNIPANSGPSIRAVTSGGAAYAPITIDASSITLKYSSTTGVVLDSAGNLGLGVTPSAWVGAKAVSVGLAGSLYADGLTYGWKTGIAANAYRTGNATWAYQNSGVRAARIEADETNPFAIHIAPSGTAGNPITFTQAMTLDASGNLLVGATATIASERFYVNGSVANYLTRNYNSNASPYGILVSYTGAAPNGTSNEFIRFDDTGALRASIRSNGGLANYSANNVNLSDVRTKTDIQDAGNYLAKICAIPVRTFKYNDQTDDLLNLGCIAQEVEAIAPELVDVSGFGEIPEDGVPLKAIYQTDLQYALMKCIQEQQAIIEELKSRLAAAGI